MPFQQKEGPEKSGSTTPPDSINPGTVLRLRKSLLIWGKENYQNYPWRTVKQPWRALITEILLQRTKAGSVVKVFNSFVTKYPELSDLANASEKDVEDLIYPLGLRWRAPLIIKLSKKLLSSEGRVPDSVEKLITLPGVGNYVAAAYISLHKNERAVIIDANIVRWICRLFDLQCNAETRRKKWLFNLAEQLTPCKNVRNFNYAMLDFTMTVCSKAPKCSICPIGPKLCLTGRKLIN